MNDNLKPCPFCNGEVILEKTNWIVGLLGVRNALLILGGIGLQKKQQAKNKWNRRADNEQSN
jgi:hypothetical protein